MVLNAQYHRMLTASVVSRAMIIARYSSGNEVASKEI